MKNELLMTSLFQKRPSMTSSFPKIFFGFFVWNCSLKLRFHYFGVITIGGLVWGHITSGGIIFNFGIILLLLWIRVWVTLLTKMCYHHFSFFFWKILEKVQNIKERSARDWVRQRNQITIRVIWHPRLVMKAADWSFGRKKYLQK